MTCSNKLSYQVLPVVHMLDSNPVHIFTNVMFKKMSINILYIMTVSYESLTDFL